MGEAQPLQHARNRPAKSIFRVTKARPASRLETASEDGLKWGKRLLIIVGMIAITSPSAIDAQPAAPGEPSPSSEPKAPPPPSGLSLVPEALAVLRDNYVETLDEDRLASEALKSLLASLDGHSTYFTREEYEGVDQNLNGTFGGIGAVVEVTGGLARVITPIDGGPSARLGVGPGWEIVRIDDHQMAGTTLSDLVRRLRGPIGSSVSVTFLDQARQQISFAIKREQVRRDSVHARRIADKGYIRISGFTRTTPDELAAVLAQFAEDGAPSGIILDLRNNPGGLVGSAASVAAHFLGPHMPLVRAGKDAASATLTCTASAMPAAPDVPIVVLVNSGTASAAEILAAALRENGRARLLGVTTYGKGLVQTIFPLNAGTNGALSITTLRYYTPLGRSIQQVGIEPDIAVARTSGEARAAMENSAPSEASLAKALANEGQEWRKPLADVAAPITDPPEGPLFTAPIPGDADIAADFQIMRAIALLAEQGSAEAWSEQGRRPDCNDRVMNRMQETQART